MLSRRRLCWPRLLQESCRVGAHRFGRGSGSRGRRWRCRRGRFRCRSRSTCSGGGTLSVAAPAAPATTARLLLAPSCVCLIVGCCWSVTPFPATSVSSLPFSAASTTTTATVTVPFAIPVGRTSWVAATLSGRSRLLLVSLPVHIAAVVHGARDDPLAVNRPSLAELLAALVDGHGPLAHEQPHVRLALEHQGVRADVRHAGHRGHVRLRQRRHNL